MYFSLTVITDFFDANPTKVTTCCNKIKIGENIKDTVQFFQKRLYRIQCSNDKFFNNFKRFQGTLTSADNS